MVVKDVEREDIEFVCKVGQDCQRLKNEINISIPVT